ncbi:glycosyltransferase [Novosphingobium sp. 9U]|uniref:glycosyltransferase n=1 Tax=Novosphingobium sp. 9U TaxID=2653158 RepID=UPI0012EF4136|nr:glycosyltransferase [Novosphingobium sp. 9U]VWX50458.1 conserved membrane hypothetical protein [Novosphingobium sp. 9U]
MKLPVDQRPITALSVLIPVAKRFDSPPNVWRAYHDALTSIGLTLEFIYVLDGPNPHFDREFEQIESSRDDVQVIRLARRFGEAACLTEAVRHASGNGLIILPPYLQIAPGALPVLIDRLATADVVTVSRDRCEDNIVNRMRGWVFEWLAGIAGSRYTDPGCIVRAVRPAVFSELVLQEEQYQFLPLLAERQGFLVEEVQLPQAEDDRRLRTHSVGSHLGGVLDVIVVGFLVAFFQKPFRFFGSIGAGLFILGLMICSALLFEKLVHGVFLADRPMLLLGVVMLVLGVQIAAVGLIAEIVIFTRTRAPSTYKIEKLVLQDGMQTDAFIAVAGDGQP